MTSPQHERRETTHRLVTNLGGLPETKLSDPLAWTPNLYDWRHSMVQLENRLDTGELVPVCSEEVPRVGPCCCELDVDPVPHHPRCPAVARLAVEWTRELVVEALRAASTDGVHAPARSDWHDPDTQGRRPTYAVVAAVFGNWTTAVKSAGLKTQPRGKPMKGRRLPPREENEDGEA